MVQLSLTSLFSNLIAFVIVIVNSDENLEISQLILIKDY